LQEPQKTLDLLKSPAPEEKRERLQLVRDGELEKVEARPRSIAWR